MKRFFFAGSLISLSLACEGAVDLGGTAEGVTSDSGVPNDSSVANEGGLTKPNDGAPGVCCPPTTGGCADVGGYRADGDCTKGRICDNMCEQRIVDDEHGCKKMVSKVPPKTTFYAGTQSCKMPVFNGCAGQSALPTAIVEPGGAIAPRPKGSALRLTVTYQASAVMIDAINGVDKVLPPSDGPFEPGKSGGYWYTLEDSSGSALYTQYFLDPTNQEVPGGPAGDGGFSNFTKPFCDKKLISVDVPNDPAGRAIVIYGPPYGKQDPTGELGRFTL